MTEPLDPGSKPDSPEAEVARGALSELRGRIEALDEALVDLIGRRRDLVVEVGRIKESLGLPVLDPPREARVVRRVAEIARKKGVDEELTRDVVWRIIASARDAQSGRTSWGPSPSAGGASGAAEPERGEPGAHQPGPAEPGQDESDPP